MNQAELRMRKVRNEAWTAGRNARNLRKEHPTMRPMTWRRQRRLTTIWLSTSVAAWICTICAICAAR